MQPIYRWFFTFTWASWRAVYQTSWKRNQGRPKWYLLHARFLYSQSSEQKKKVDNKRENEHTHTHTHPFNGPFSGTTQVSRYQKGKTNLDFTEARDSECRWHQLGHMQVCTQLQTDNHASTSPLSFLQKTNTVKLNNVSLQEMNSRTNRQLSKTAVAAGR